jgi:hypothetical protein
MYSIGNGFQVLLLLPCGAAEDSLTHHHIPEDLNFHLFFMVLNMFVHGMVLKLMEYHEHPHCIFTISG